MVWNIFSQFKPTTSDSELCFKSIFAHQRQFVGSLAEQVHDCISLQLCTAVPLQWRHYLPPLPHCWWRWGCGWMKLCSSSLALLHFSDAQFLLSPPNAQPVQAGNVNREEIMNESAAILNLISSFYLFSSPLLLSFHHLSERERESAGLLPCRLWAVILRQGECEWQSSLTHTPPPFLYIEWEAGCFKLAHVMATEATNTYSIPPSPPSESWATAAAWRLTVPELQHPFRKKVSRRGEGEVHIYRSMRVRESHCEWKGLCAIHKSRQKTGCRTESIKSIN